MLSSLLRPRRRRQRIPQPPSSPPIDQSSPLLRHQDIRHATADWTETENDEDDTEEENDHDDQDVIENRGIADGDEEGEGEEGEDEDGEENTPLLPLFSAVHLVYNLTHAIRLVIVPRCETTLTWDQLRSPQVSQFLIKPMQQQIRTAHFSRGTLYALMANCLQFGKEGHMSPGNSGISSTRAMVCELLATKLLREYTTRELIDALSYDFFPLQGLLPQTPPGGGQANRPRPAAAAARISTLEVAIRAQAKRFLAHPLVVQQLEAIWAGTIVFHSAADHLHRPKIPARHSRYASIDQVTVSSCSAPAKGHKFLTGAELLSTRRSVTLYDPQDASLFKLSRLRVPRYRQFFSTCSLAIMLGLFLAVLSERSVEITTLEVIFWFWSAGFMLDELVGFNEQGFSLYIMSVWNAFDLGILLMLMLYYGMRLYGIFLVGAGKHHWNSMAYDVLAANAVLLFPRLFSVLDHYRYFSQLLIAFRLMAVDLAAVFILIIISCSGFFVAFTLSFGKNEYDAYGVAYALFQLIMGFTPAAWQAWDSYNPLGRALLALFLFICHFLIVTILITVLTNSFMAIVSNANAEHQFLFAVNTISMVKNDALFSYVAPSNILAWFLAPMRFMMPFRLFVKLNRYVIKFTHFPLLFTIFAYEKLVLASSVYEPTDLIEQRGKARARARVVSFLDPAARAGLFSPSLRVKQASVAGFQKDRALEEVFRLTPRGGLRNSTKSQERRQTSHVVNNWMDQQEGIASSPPEQDRAVVDRLERNRRTSRLARLQRRTSGGNDSRPRSAASDPADLMSVGMSAYRDFAHPQSDAGVPTIALDHHMAQTEDEGDDELATHEDDENMTLDKRSRSNFQPSVQDNEEEDYFQTPKAGRLSVPLATSMASSHARAEGASPAHARQAHSRNMSTNTIVFNPVAYPSNRRQSSSSISSPKDRPTTATRFTPVGTGTNTPSRRAPQTKARPILPNRNQFQSAPNRSGLFGAEPRAFPRAPLRHRLSSLDLDITSETGLDAHNPIGAVPSSFATQMAMAAGLVKSGANAQSDGDRLMGRLMLARMKTLEEGFAEVVREFKEMRTQGNSPVEQSAEERRREKGKRLAMRRRSRPGSKTGAEAATPEAQVLTQFAAEMKGSSL